MRLIDFAARKIAPHDIKAAGFEGVVAYVSAVTAGHELRAKPITREYADALRARDCTSSVISNMASPGGRRRRISPEGSTGGPRRPHGAGLHEAAGGPDSAPILFSVDDDIDLGTWNRVGVEWFRGINSVLGVERTGIYGHSRVCAWAIQDGVIGHSTSPGRRWAWQTKAWSYGGREPAAVLFQNVIDTPSNPGPLVGGTRVDVNEVLAADFGQWDLDRSLPRPAAGLRRFSTRAPRYAAPTTAPAAAPRCCGSCCTPRTETVRLREIWPVTSRTTTTRSPTTTPSTTTGMCTTSWTPTGTRILFCSRAIRSPSIWRSPGPRRAGRVRPGSTGCGTASTWPPISRYATRAATGCRRG